jgi:hypothetical protein
MLTELKHMFSIVNNYLWQIINWIFMWCITIILLFIQIIVFIMFIMFWWPIIKDIYNWSNKQWTTNEQKYREVPYHERKTYDDNGNEYLRPQFEQVD